MNDWEIVRQAFEDEALECEGCEFYGYDYATDTGADIWCGLGDIAGHNPRWCPAFERVKEEVEDV